MVKIPRYITDSDAANDKKKLDMLKSKKEAAYKKYQMALANEQKAKKAVDDALKAIKVQEERMGERGTLYYPRKVKTTSWVYAWCNHK